jgi:hypothetical protein
MAPCPLYLRGGVSRYRAEIAARRRALLHCTLHTAHCTLHTAHCTLHIAHCTLHTAHCTLHTAHCTLHIAHCTLHTEKGAAASAAIAPKLQRAAGRSFIAHCTLHNAHCFFLSPYLQNTRKNLFYARSQNLKIKKMSTLFFTAKYYYRAFYYFRSVDKMLFAVSNHAELG